MEKLLILCRCVDHQILSRSVVDYFEKIIKSYINTVIVDDLCWAVAVKNEELLKIFKTAKDLFVVACRERAVKWLLYYSGIKLDNISVIDIRDKEDKDIEMFDDNSLFGKIFKIESKNNQGIFSPIHIKKEGEWRGWFPVIDYSRCKGCTGCIEFCPFGVYVHSSNKKPFVDKPTRCKDGCPACARQCSELAIIFPKCSLAPLEGSPVLSDYQKGFKLKTDLQRDVSIAEYLKERLKKYSKE